MKTNRIISTFVLIAILAISSILTGCTSTADANALCAPNGVESWTWYGSITCKPAGTTTDAPAKAPCYDWLIGGRLDQNGDYYMYLGAISHEFIVSGAPLQEYVSQVTAGDFVNNLKLDENLENFNDGVKAVIICDKAYIMPQSDDAAVPHSAISHITYIPSQGVLICYDDDGTKGTLIGACSGATQMITESMPLNQFLASGFFKPWAEQFTSVSGQFDGQIFNGHIELLATFR